MTLTVTLGSNSCWGKQSHSRDDIDQVFARALRIEAYEQIVRIQQEFAELKQQLIVAEVRFKSGQGSAIERFERATQYRDLLSKAAQNRAAYAATGHQNNDGAQYTERAAALGPEITALETTARMEKVKNTLQALDAQTLEVTKLESQLKQKPPSTLPEWNARSETLDRYTQVLLERQRLYAVLRENGQAASSSDIALLENQTRQASQLRQKLDEDRQRVQLGELDNLYRQMDRKRVQLEDSYVRAFATAQEATAKQAVLLHLEKMKANRLEAQQKGEAAAAVQLKRVDAEIGKFSKK